MRILHGCSFCYYSRMSTNRNLRKGLLDFLEKEAQESIDDDDNSENEEEEIYKSDHDTQSEQSDDEMEETQISEGEYYFGRIEQIAFQGDVHKSAKRTQIKQSYHVKIKKSLKWKKDPYSEQSKEKNSNIVKISSGLTSVTKDITDEVSAFHKIIDLSMVDDIVKYTNIYIEYKRNAVSYERNRDCQDTTRCEILALIGTLFIIGTKKGSHTNVLELWATNGTGIQILRAVMSYKRFLFLLRCLRFDDKSTRNERKQTDKLAPIRSMLDSFVKNCKNSYSMSEYVTIDEMLHPFRGRCNFVQNISSKPARYGLRCFAMCDAKTFYTSNLEIYCGKQPSGPFCVSNSPTNIVKRLTEPIKGSNRNLTTDNWYTSLPLATYLLKKKITLLGTMHRNKPEIPSEFLPRKNREIQSSLFGFRKQATLVSYVPKQNKAIILLSTMHNLPDIDEKSGKPEILLSYNETKGAVDTVDKMCAVYSVSRITNRWPLALFFAILNIAGINSQILYFTKYCDRDQYRRRIFLTDLALGLMKEQLALRAKQISLPMDIQAFLQKNVSVEEEDQSLNHHRKRGRCKFCKNTCTTLTCHGCTRFVCKKHSTLLVICKACETTHNQSEIDS